VKTYRRFLVPLLAAASVAGCSDNSTGPQTLTSAQAQAMAGALFSITRNASSTASDSTAQTSPAATSAQAATVQTHIQLDAPCRLGGTVGLDASLEGSADSTMIDMTLGVVEVPHACVAVDQDSGMQFVFTGAPSLTASYHLYSNYHDSLTLNGSYSGAVDWTSDTGSGTCSVDVGFDGMWNPADQSGSATLQGTVCNVQIQSTVTHRMSDCTVVGVGRAEDADAHPAAGQSPARTPMPESEEGRRPNRAKLASR